MRPADDESNQSIRRPVLAGTWYPGSESELAAELQGFHERAPAPRSSAPVRAVIVPHAGYRYSGQTAAHAYRAFEGQRFERVLVLGPSHRDGFHGLALLDVAAFETPLGRVPLDRAAVRTLLGRPPFRDRPQAHAREHSLEIQLPFLQRSAARDVRIVPVVVGWLDEQEQRVAAARLREIADEHTLIVVSSDFTHYGAAFGFEPFGGGPDVSTRIAELDRGAIDTILAGDPRAFRGYCERTGATICGAGPIELFLRMSEAEDLGASLLDYTRSGDQTGDFAHCVSYAAIEFHDLGRIGPSERDLLFRIARAALADAVRGTRPSPPAREAPPWPPVLTRLKGVFVTLRDRGELRGCVGQLKPTHPLHQAVAESAVSAALDDPRFPPVTEAEVDRLEMDISVLSRLVPIEGPDEIAVGRDGLLVSAGGRRGTLLPQVAREYGYDGREFLERTLQKAGIEPDEVEHGLEVEIHRYEAQVLEEPRGSRASPRSDSA